MTAYASWALGGMPGTINSNFPLWFPALQQQVLTIRGFTVNVPKETVHNHELGLKQQLSRFRYAVTAYHMFWRNIKNQVNFVCLNNQCGPTITSTTILVNVPQKARISGVELELGAQLTENWDINGSFDYVRVRTVRFLQLAALGPTGRTDASGKVITGFPVTQGAVTTNYRGELNADWGWYVRGSMTYTGRIYTDEINQSWIGDAIRVNAHFGVEKDGVRFEVYGSNLFNDKHWTSSNRGTQSNYHLAATVTQQASATVHLPRLRTFGFKVTAQY